ncbi:MAG: Na/Pi cotransporter family protein [Clostridia bacterium]|nr:Na/Pi cotransporter family protein [Clostridia bacterium]
MIGEILSLFSGIGTFLLGMKLISKHLQSVAGGKVEKLFNKISNSKIMSVGVGVGSAAVLQSSSATTVILVSLVNSGIITLLQATCIIMGANIGTTFTALIISFNYLPIGELFAFLTFVGVMLVMTNKNERVVSLGWIVGSAGLMFIGLDIIKLSSQALSGFSSFSSLFNSLNSPFFLLLLGAAFTAVIQSSSALTGIVITFAHLGIMPVTGAFYLIMGGNIGSCATALLASIGGQVNAKRTALINLLFNVIGVVIFLPFVILFGSRVTTWLKDLSVSVIIAYFHIVFNSLTTVLLLPFTKKLTELSVILIGDEKRKNILVMEKKV